MVALEGVGCGRPGTMGGPPFQGLVTLISWFLEFLGVASGSFVCMGWFCFVCSLSYLHRLLACIICGEGIRISGLVFLHTWGGNRGGGSGFGFGIVCGYIFGAPVILVFFGLVGGGAASTRVSGWLASCRGGGVQGAGGCHGGWCVRCCVIIWDVGAINGVWNEGIGVGIISTGYGT